MASRCNGHGYTTATSVSAPAIAVEPAPAQVAVPNNQCGKMIQTKDADGKPAIYFTVCPPSAAGSAMTEAPPQLPAGESRPITRGVEVRSVTTPHHNAKR
jgi:hypothetical protein